jgi:hypothetical protein
MDSSSTGGHARSRTLVVTGDLDWLDEILRLAAEADVEVDVATDATCARRLLDAAPLVLVTDDAVGRSLARTAIPSRTGVVYLGRDPEGDAAVWESATDLGAEHVAFLPEAEAWLIDRLARAALGSASDATVVCVMGGCGGAGATTLASALALTAAGRSVFTTLIEADPLGGGIDEMPSLGHLCVLSWGLDSGFHITPAAMMAALSTMRRSTRFVVVDLPRRLDEAARVALQQARTTLLVVPAEVRACASAVRVVEQMREHCADLRVVIRSTSSSGLSATQIAETLDLPLAGEVLGEPDEFCGRFLEELGIGTGHNGGHKAA